MALMFTATPAYVFVFVSFYCNAIFLILTYWFNFDNTILNRVLL